MLKPPAPQWDLKNSTQFSEDREGRTTWEEVGLGVCPATSDRRGGSVEPNATDTRLQF